MPKAKLKKEDIARCVKLKEHGCTNRDISKMMGVAEQTFCQWTKHPRNELQEELAEALDRAEAKAKDTMLQCIMRAAIEDRDWHSAAWYLERKYPNEYAKTSRVVNSFEGVQLDDLSAAFEFEAEELEKKRAES